MDLEKSLNIPAAGLRAQGTRLRVISENIANANSTAQTPGGEPYRRKLVTFDNELDRSLGIETVRVDSIVADRSAFSRRYEPGHPAADADGYVLSPNTMPLMVMPRRIAWSRAASGVGPLLSTPLARMLTRSEERRLGKEWVVTCRSRW